MPVPTGKRYDPDVNVRGGNTKLVVSRDRRLRSRVPGARRHPHQLRRRRRRRGARGSPARRSSTTARSSPTSRPAPASRTGTRSRSRLTPTAPSRRSRSSTPAASRTRPSRGWTARCTRPRTAATRASTASCPSGARRRPAISRPSAARCRRSSCAGARTSTPTPPTPARATRSNGSPIDEPNPLTDTVRAEAQAKGAAIFDRTEGIWTAGDRVYFDCTTGGDAGLGQLWEFRPRPWGGDLKLIYESVGRRGPREPRQPRGRPADRRRLPAGGLRRRAVRPRRHAARADLRLRPHRRSTAPSSAAAASAPTGGPSSSTSRATG